MGARRRLQHRCFEPGLAFILADALRRPRMAKGVERVEASSSLEDNRDMRNIIGSLGGRISKRHRVYGEPLLTR